MFDEKIKKEIEEDLKEIEACESDLILFFGELAQKYGTEIALMCLGKLLVVSIQGVQDNPKATLLCSILKVKVIEGLLDETGQYNPSNWNKEKNDEEDAKRTASQFGQDINDIFGD